MLPVRCYTCGKVLGHLEKEWTDHRSVAGMNDWHPFFEKYRIERYCCRRVIMCHEPDINHEMHYELPPSVASIKEEDDTEHRRFFLAR